MKMKVLTLSMVLTFVVSVGGLMAQQPALGGPQKQKIETAKIAYLTKEMQLTPDEAKVFWPLYEALQTTLDEERRGRAQQQDQVRENFKNLSDEQINVLIDKRMGHAEAVAKAHKSFIQQLRKELSPRKVMSYFNAIDQFQRELAGRADRPKADFQKANRPRSGRGQQRLNR